MRLLNTLKYKYYKMQNWWGLNLSNILLLYINNKNNIKY